MLDRLCVLVAYVTQGRISAHFLIYLRFAPAAEMTRCGGFGAVADCVKLGLV